MGRRKKGEIVNGWVCLDKPLEMGSTEAVSAALSCATKSKIFDRLSTYTGTCSSVSARRARCAMFFTS